MTKKFDSLIESILNEMMPATSEYDPSSMGATVARKISELPGKSQHWAALQKLSEEDRAKVVQSIIETVFSDNGDHTYSLSIDDPAQLKEAIKDAIKLVSKEIPEFEIGEGKWAVQFLADRLANKELLGKVKYTTSSGEDVVDKKMTQKEFKQALRKALEEPLDAGSEEDGIDDEDLEVEGEEETISKKVSYSSRAEYYLKTYKEIPAGKLSGDARVTYDRLSGMSGEVHSGQEFVDQLKKSDLGERQVNQLLDLGVLEPADNDMSDVGDTEGFKETEQDYIERITRAAREDFKSSDLGPKYSGIQFD